MRYTGYYTIVVSFYQPSMRKLPRTAGPKIALRFPHLSACSLFVCTSA